MMKKITIHAPTKINLFLDVVGRRANGYHDIESVMQTVSLADLLEITQYDAATETEIEVLCSEPSIPSGEGNIVYRAAKAFFGAMNIQNYKISFVIKKITPAEAGLGGGSADAAAAIIALDRLYETHLTAEQMCEIGVTVGADVPFCIRRGTATVTGIGEIMEDAPCMPDCALLVAMPKGSKISTAEAYRKIDAMPKEPHATLSDVVNALKNGDLSALAVCLYNKFEAVTPEETGSHALCRKMRELGAIGARMSGSGPSVFGIFQTESEASAAAKAFEGEARVFVCKPLAR